MFLFVLVVSPTVILKDEKWTGFCCIVYLLEVSLETESLGEQILASRAANYGTNANTTLSRLPHLQNALRECEYAVSTAERGFFVSPHFLWDGAVRFHATLPISTSIHHRTGSR